jgi:SAM-dependent methyltransferase
MKKKGKYLVDVACGPIHYDAYRAMSDGYDYRICIDVSFEALREAKRQMGDRGIYLMADITNMPLQDQSVDDVISLHTLYHVPADRQITALKEIYRILKPDATGIVIYSWGKHSLLMRGALLPVRLLERMRLLPERNNGLLNMNEPQLYFHTHNSRFLNDRTVDFEIDIVVWSSINSGFTKTYISDGRAGRLLLKIIGKLEDYFPHASGRFGAYPLFVIKKSSGQ